MGNLTRVFAFAIFCLFAPYVCAETLSPQTFLPEEAQRSTWDRGCADWPQELPGTYSKNVPAFAVERGNDQFRFLAKVEFKPERGESLEDFRTSLEKFLSDFRDYPAWVMPGINEHPLKGESYFVDLEDLQYRPGYPQENYDAVLYGPYYFKALGMKLKGYTTIQMELKKTGTANNAAPVCPLFKDQKSPTRLTFRMLPRADILDWLVGELWLVHNSESSEFRIRISMKPAKLIYTFLPKAVLESDLKYRSKRLMGNILEFKRMRYAQSLKSPAKSGASVKTRPLVQKSDSAPKR